MARRSRWSRGFAKFGNEDGLEFVVDNGRAAETKVTFQRVLKTAAPAQKATLPTVRDYYCGAGR